MTQHNHISRLVLACQGVGGGRGAVSDGRDRACLMTLPAAAVHVTVLYGILLRDGRCLEGICALLQQLLQQCRGWPLLSPCVSQELWLPAGQEN
jgi:hypothetical protein